MLLPRFEFHEPATVEEACRILGELGEKAKTLAGGTDLFVNMKKKVLAPEHVVSLDRIESLAELEFLNGTLRIGACAKASEIADSDAVKADFPALQEGAGKLGSPLIRNLATVGGNLVSARPAADFPPPLMAYGAKVLLKSSKGERTVELADFIEAPGQTVLATDEILESILLEKPALHSGSAYLKLGLREALEISLVNVAVCMTTDGADGPITAARVVMGSVGPTPLISASAEKTLLGKKPSEALFLAAGEAAAMDSRPIDDFRASADYKRAMVKELTRRALAQAYERAQSE
ncbi:MAG: xanthine dehydrogenase family protein subunit M [Deltaproteobacteria bacterium]|nr:xanthine dehydrogenase family protein subunit M [Deltaproteobacteria bacterium]